MLFRSGKGEGDHFVVGVVDFVVDKEVEAYSVQPLGGLVIRSIKGFRCSDTEFGGFQGGHGRRWSWERWGGEWWCVGQGKWGKRGKDWVGGDWSWGRGSGGMREMSVCELVG